jgi:hypothetical protein
MLANKKCNLVKVAELYDHPIFGMLGVASGHTLKHLLATAAAALIVGCLIRRARLLTS